MKPRTPFFITIALFSVTLGVHPEPIMASEPPGTQQDEEPPFYFSDGQRIDLTPAKFVAVRFREGAEFELADRYPEVQGTESRYLAPQRLTLFQLQDGVATAEVEALLDDLETRAEIELVAPVFDAPGALMIVTDEFIAQFREGVDRAAIDRLNARFSVEVVNELEGAASTYLLRVQRGNSLDTANAFHRAPEVVYSHPDFIRIRSRVVPAKNLPGEAMIFGPDGEVLPPTTRIEKGAEGYRVVEPSYRALPSPTEDEVEAIPMSPVTRQTIKAESFEGAFPNTWTRYGTPTWDDVTYRKYNGSWSGYCVGSAVSPPGPYPDDVNSWMVYGPFSLVGAQDARVNFQAWIRTEAYFDFLGIYASTNGADFFGDAWSGDWASGSGGAGWMNISFDLKRVYSLGDLRGESQVWIALVFSSDYIIGYEGAYVDDVVIERINGGYQNITNDQYDHLQWSLNNNEQLWGVEGADIQAEDAWTLSHGSASITAAIIDTGVDLTHPDITGKLVTGYDATGGGSSGGPTGNHPLNAHGTACAGIVAAVTDNGQGVAGIARAARIMPVRIGYVLDDGSQMFQDSWTVAGINWAVSQGADVLSNSWGGGSPSTAITQAIENAKTSGRGGKGSVVLFAAGNDNGPVSYPATLSAVLAVGALSPCDQRKAPTSCDGEYWWGSSYGSELDIMAPGVHMYTTDISGSGGLDPSSYFYDFNGTSSATPVVAGVAALLLGYDPALTAAQVEANLESSADDLGTPGWDSQTGWGRVNAFRALDLLVPDCYTLTLGHTGSGSNPTASPAHSSGCAAGEYQEGESITLTASPAVGWRVSSWWGTDDDVSTSATNTVSMPPSNHSAGVNYTALPTFTLSVTKTGTGSGIVVSAPPGINCGADCQQDYFENTVVVLSGLPSLGSELTSWTGHADCTDGLVTMSGPRSCTATFNTCSSQSEYFLEDATVSTLEEYSACNHLHVGPNVQVTGTGELVLFAGNGATFYEGFRILSGGEMQVHIGEPMP